MKKVVASCVAGMVVGIAILVSGLYMAFGFSSSFNGKTPEDASFGADFYTFQYEATQIAAQNVNRLGTFTEKAVNFGFKAGGFAIAAAGLAIGTFFELRLNEAKHREELAAHTPAPVQTYAQPYAQPYAQQEMQQAYYQPAAYQPTQDATTTGYPQYPGNDQGGNM